MVVFLFNFVIHAFLLLCLCILIVYLCIFIVMYDLFFVFCFTVLYSVSFCCFVYCSCVTVHRTTDTVFQPNCSSQIYIYQNYKEYFLGYE